MIKRIASYVLVFLAGVGVCYLWVAKTNPQVATDMMPSFTKKTPTGPTLATLQRPKALSGTMQSINGKDLEVNFSILGQKITKKLSVGVDTPVFIRQIITEKERFGTYYEEYKALQAKATSTLAVKARLELMKSISAIRMKVDRERIKIIQDLNTKLMALKPEQVAEKDALTKQIADVRASSRLVAAANTSFAVGDKIIVYLKNPNDIDQGTIKPEKVEIIK